MTLSSQSINLLAEIKLEEEARLNALPALAPKLTSIDSALKQLLTADSGGKSAWIMHHKEKDVSPATSSNINTHHLPQQGDHQQHQLLSSSSPPSPATTNIVDSLQQTQNSATYDPSAETNSHFQAPMRQKYTVLLHEMLLFERHQETYQKMLETEAYATWYYIDQLACFVVHLKDLKRKELLVKARTAQISKQRRALEGEELKVREILESSYMQELRLLCRSMNAKRSLLSTKEYKSQKDRVSRQMEMLLGDALNGV